MRPRTAYLATASILVIALLPVPPAAAANPGTWFIVPCAQAENTWHYWPHSDGYWRVSIFGACNFRNADCGWDYGAFIYDCGPVIRSRDCTILVANFYCTSTSELMYFGDGDWIMAHYVDPTHADNKGYFFVFITPPNGEGNAEATLSDLALAAGVPEPVLAAAVPELASGDLEEGVGLSA